MSDEQRQIDAYLAQHFGIGPDAQADDTEAAQRTDDDSDPDLHPGSRTDHISDDHGVDRYMKAHRLDR